MKIYKIAQEEKPTKSIENVKNLIPEFITKAQNEYDKWNESDIDEYAGGGICHLIADQISEVLSNNDIICSTVSSDFEQHVYCVVQVKEGIYMVDIHHSTYETGGGFSWEKIPDITFEPNDIIIYKLDEDWNAWSKYVDYI